MNGEFLMTRNLVLSIVSLAIVASAPVHASSLIERGNLLSWSSSSGQGGALKITSVDGQYFEAEQTNDFNRAAGTVRLYGAIVDHGHRAVLINAGQWKEVWDGEIARDEIAGRLTAGNAEFTFRIKGGYAAAPVMAFTAPFLSGRTLRWTSEAMGGQSGTLFVASVEGHKFLLEQVNARNPAAGVTKLEGEIKDGKVFIYNRKWNETWIGIVEHGTVFGKVNNRTDFKIFE
jgi:hypothetical protein